MRKYNYISEEQRGKAPAIGTTITIARGAGKGTVVIKKAESPPDNTGKKYPSFILSIC